MNDKQREAFANANMGRRVRVARGGFASEARKGTIVGVMLGGDGGIRARYDGEALAFWDDAENLDPIDGLGPLKFPNAVTPPGYIENVKVDAVIVPPYAELAEKAREVLGAGAGRVTPPPKVDPLAAVTRTLNLLHSLSPLPCWTVDQERELVACGRELLAVVRALQSAVKK